MPLSGLPHALESSLSSLLHHTPPTSWRVSGHTDDITVVIRWALSSDTLWNKQRWPSSSSYCSGSLDSDCNTNVVYNDDSQKLASKRIESQGFHGLVGHTQRKVFRNENGNDNNKAKMTIPQSSTSSSSQSSSTSKKHKRKHSSSSSCSSSGSASYYSNRVHIDNDIHCGTSIDVQGGSDAAVTCSGGGEKRRSKSKRGKSSSRTQTPTSSGLRLDSGDCYSVSVMDSESCDLILKCDVEEFGSAESHQQPAIENVISVSEPYPVFISSSNLDDSSELGNLDDQPITADEQVNYVTALSYQDNGNEGNEDEQTITIVTTDMDKQMPNGDTKEGIIKIPFDPIMPEWNQNGTVSITLLKQEEESDFARFPQHDSDISDTATSSSHRHIRRVGQSDQTNDVVTHERPICKSVAQGEVSSCANLTPRQGETKKQRHEKRRARSSSSNSKRAHSRARADQTNSTDSADGNTNSYNQNYFYQAVAHALTKDPPKTVKRRSSNSILDRPNESPLSKPFTDLRTRLRFQRSTITLDGDNDVDTCF